MSIFDNGVPVGISAQAIAQDVTMAATITACEIVSLPNETIEGLLLAAETFIIVQIATGRLDKKGAEDIRAKISTWGNNIIDHMENNGTADEIRSNYNKVIENNVKKDGDKTFN